MKKYISLLFAAALFLTGCINESVKKVEILDEYAGAKTKVTLPADPIPAEGGTIVATVSSEVPFKVSLAKTATWLTATAASDQITFTAAANTSAEKRWTSVSLIDPDTNFAITSFDITQAGTEKVIILKKFAVSTEEIAVRADQTEAIFTITAEVPWTATSDNEAFTLAPASGSENATVTVTFPANTVPEAKVAHITVATTAEDVQTPSYTITLTQEAGKEVVPAVKPAPGTVLAEWRFVGSETENLRKGGFEQLSSSPEVDAIGNMGGAYVPSNISGNGRLEFYNGIDKSTVKTKTCVKRAIGSRGEPVIYGTWAGDYFLWIAETEAPIAAGTKIHLFFALRPNNENVMRDWQCEYLDGTEWKQSNLYQLRFAPNAAGTADDPKQFNEMINETVTLTQDTPTITFRFTCTQNMNCVGSPITALTANWVLRFAGEWDDATGDNIPLQVHEHPRIEVVE
jgi:hypothetical protein